MQGKLLPRARGSATLLRSFPDREEWAEFVARALNERVRLIGFRGVFAEILAPGGLKLNVDEPQGGESDQRSHRFTKDDIVQAMADQGAAWEEHSDQGQTEPDVHLQQWFEPGALTAAIALFFRTSKPSYVTTPPRKGAR
jgi:hypothetical protein